MTLCPEILRQRLVIEGLYGIENIDEQLVTGLLDGLTQRLCMTPIADTLLFSPDDVSALHHGIGGFQAWAESGCSLYTWRESHLFTLDVYSCKRFAAAECIAVTEALLRPSRLTWREV